MYGLALRLRAHFRVFSIFTAVLFCPAGHALVISQIYGGGGNSGATFTNDFIELFNDTPSAVTLDGMTVQYTSAGGTTWQATALSGNVDPYRYFLIQEAAGSGGTTALPTPDIIGSIGLSASSGKVALVNGLSLLSLSATCTNLTLVDLVGFGSADCYEGSAAGPHLSNTLAIARMMGGLTDTNDNAADFSLVTPNPRNSTYSANIPLLPVDPGEIVNTVNEPGSILLMIIGLAAVTARRRRAVACSL